MPAGQPILPLQQDGQEGILSSIADEAFKSGHTAEVIQLRQTVANLDTVELHEKSSYGKHSNAVKDMKESHKKGIPLAFYEIMQGMVTYGRNHTPPPRIYFVMSGGERIMFDGSNTPDSNEGMEAIEFENHGPGLAPEDTVINMPDPDAPEESLGEHGHGMTIALAYLTSIGLPVKISSNHKGRQWKGITSLRPTTTGKTEILHMDGAMGAKVDKIEERTVFRIECPTEELLDDLRKVPDMFLFANPNYPGAVIVPFNSECEEKESVIYPLDKGQLRCLTGVVPEQNSYNFIYIDGLKIPICFNITVLPWDIQGLKDTKTSHLKIARSNDSTSLNGELSEVIPLAVAQIQDKKILKKIIKTAIDNKDTYYYELKEPYYGKKGLSEETKKIIQEIWAEDYDNAIIDYDKDRVDRTGGEFKGRKVLLVSNDLFNFLRKADIDFLLIEKGAEDAREVKNLQRLHVPDAKEPKALDSLIEKAALSGAMVDIVKVQGVQHLRIKIPHVICTDAEFGGLTQSDFGKLMRLAAIIAGQQNIDLRAFSLDGDYYNQIHIVPYASNYRGENDYYATAISIEQYGLGDLENDFLSYEAGSTYLLLSGEQINTFENPNRLQLLLEMFLNILAELKKKASQFALRRKGAVSRMLQQPDVRADISHSTIDSVPASDIDAGNTMLLEDGIDCESRITPGNYRKEVGARLSFARESLSWSSECQWTEAAVPNRGMRKNESKSVERNIIGSRRLIVKHGHKIACYKTVPKNAKLTFYYDVKNGLYVAIGDADVLEYHTSEDKKEGALNRRPTAEELENPLKASDYLLAEHWQKFFKTIIKDNPKLSSKGKAMLAANEWNDRFSHEGQTDIGGDTKSAAAACAINNCRGESSSYSTGLAILLRAIGVASRVVSGYIVDSDFRYSRQTWVEYYDGEKWHPLAGKKQGLQFKPEELPVIVDERRPKPRPYIVDAPKVDYMEKIDSSIIKPRGTVAKIARAVIIACLLGLGGAAALAIADKDTRTEIENLFDSNTSTGSRNNSAKESSKSFGGQICEAVCGEK